MNDMIVVTLTLTSGILVIYHHLGYPLILRIVGRRRSDHEVKATERCYTPSTADNELPTITIMIPAYNEQQWIAEKIRNLAVLDYPASHLRVIIGCDGCSDDTATIAKQTANETECKHLAIDIHEFEHNRGKVAVINEMIRGIDSELVALSDASALVSVDALLLAAEHFKDASIGVLSSCYRLLNPGSTGEIAYWHYQRSIKTSEAVLGSTLGAHGAFYLFRRSLFRPLAADTINDDTATIAKQTANETECKHLAIDIHEFEHNRGKVAVINEMIRGIDSELVALSDASALVSVDALLLAAEHFKDASIGVLSSCYRLLNPGSTGEIAYWHYQRSIKTSEAVLGSTLGAHGAFYLFRRSLFRPLAADTINDDFILPMEIVAVSSEHPSQPMITRR